MTTQPTYQVRDARTEKRFFVDNVIIRGYGKALGVYGVAVYSTLCMHANLETQQGYPSHSKIADLLDCSIGKVKDAIKLLEELKLIHTTPRYDKETHRQTSNLYTLLSPPVPPVTIDTPPRHAGMTTNNPHLDQSYLKEEPPLADSPPAEDSLHVPLSRLPPQDPTFWAEGETPPEPSPHEPVEQGKARRCRELGTDPLGVAAVVEQNRAAVAHPDGGDPQSDFDVWWKDATRAFCAVAHVDYETLKPSSVIDWPRQIKKWADGWEDAAPTSTETVQCLRGILESEHAWKTFTSPRQPSFQETMDVMLSRLRGGQPWNAEGKKANGASGRRNKNEYTPTDDQKRRYKDALGSRLVSA